MLSIVRNSSYRHNFTLVKHFFLLFILGLCISEGNAQAQQPNLIPNPSFEEFRVRPLGWYYKGAQYNRVIRYWRSPTAASPDAYNPDVRVPRHWAEKGFGQQKPFDGGAMSGITLYGCADGKPHCREYLQTQLIENLVPGQRYEFSMEVAALPRGLRCDRLGAAFLSQPVRFEDDRLVPAKPDVVFTKVADPGKGWMQLKTSFTATGNEIYILIGNFSPDSETTTAPPIEEPHLPFAYYYIDQVELRKLQPLIPVKVDANDLSQRELKSGEAITLRNVYFDTDSDELQPRSFRELNKLVLLMKRFGDVRVRIVGHTDNEGNAEYNEALSQRRAATVVRYLEEHGIDTYRLETEGRGQREPVATNDTSEGRQLNRRVVAEVL